MKRIVAILLLVAGVALGIFWYVQRAKTRALNSGDVYVREQPGENPKPLPPSPPASAAAPAAPAPATPAPSPSASTTSPAAPAPKPSAAIIPSVTPAPVPATTRPATPSPSRQATGKLPSLDSIPREAPSGALYAAAGKYQLYRQGDLTWRLNTDTGWACVIFATDTQWSKTRVWREGCRTSGDVSPPVSGN
jgi:hypothetical protein